MKLNKAICEISFIPIYIILLIVIVIHAVKLPFLLAYVFLRHFYRVVVAYGFIYLYNIKNNIYMFRCDYRFSIRRCRGLHIHINEKLAKGESYIEVYMPQHIAKVIIPKKKTKTDWLMMVGDNRIFFYNNITKE